VRAHQESIIFHLDLDFKWKHGGDDLGSAADQNSLKPIDPLGANTLRIPPFAGQALAARLPSFDFAFLPIFRS
jgi:hypothetical protein